VYTRLDYDSKATIEVQRTSMNTDLDVTVI